MYHRMLSGLQLTAGQTEQVMAAMKQLFGRAIDKYVANVLPMTQVMQQRSFFCPFAHHNEQEFRQLFSEPQFASDSWSFEIQRYCAKVPASASAGEFWQEQEHELPRLSVLAMQLLCVPSSSAYVESCFSVARAIQRLHRARMSASLRKDELRCRVSRSAVADLLHRAANLL